MTEFESQCPPPLPKYHDFGQIKGPEFSLGHHEDSGIILPRVGFMGT